MQIVHTRLNLENIYSQSLK